MLQVEQISEVRLSLARGESMRSIAKRCKISRNTVRKIVRSGRTAFSYKSRRPKYRVLEPYQARLEELLAARSDQPRKERLTMLGIYGILQSEGYEGGYDAVRRYAGNWREERTTTGNAFVPLVFAKGEAFQFDWSEEGVELGGVPVKVYVAHICLCHSRMRFCIAFTRMNLEMVLAAHIVAHDFFGGLCGVGIYDNLKSVVSRIGKGKEREYNSRFQQLASHYLFEPRACTPASGWEKGQVENQVKTVRQQVFTPRLRFNCLEDLNAHLREEMLLKARNQRHPEFSEKSIWQVFEEEIPYLRHQSEAFDGYCEEQRRAGMDCLVHYDRNMYSIPCGYAGRAVCVRVYAGRIVLAIKGEAVAEHRREFGKGHYVLDPLHYLPVLSRKPGALRNGRPFLEWDMPAPLRAVWEGMRRYPDWDRQMSKVFAAIPRYGLEAVSVACETALEQGVVSEAVILNYLERLTEETPPCPVRTPEKLLLAQPPLADCARYDRLLGRRACSASIS
jgi:transposase